MLLFVVVVGATAPTSILTFPLLLVFCVVLVRPAELCEARCAGNCGMIFGGLDGGREDGRLDVEALLVAVEGVLFAVKAGAV